MTSLFHICMRELVSQILLVFSLINHQGWLLIRSFRTSRNINRPMLLCLEVSG